MVSLRVGQREAVKCKTEIYWLFFSYVGGRGWRGEEIKNYSKSLGDNANIIQVLNCFLPRMNGPAVFTDL